MVQINEIYNEDVIYFLKRISDDSIDLIISDPPYNINVDKWDEFKNEKTYFEFIFSYLDLSIKKLKTNGSIYLFNNPYNSAFILNFLVSKKMFFKNWILWYKKDGFSSPKTKFVSNQEVILFFTKSKGGYTFNYDDVRVPYESKDRLSNGKGILKNGRRWYPNPNGKMCTDVWQISSHRHKTKVKGKIVKSFHATPKPEDMIERIVKASSNKGDLVLDLFSGTGTTSYISKKLERNFIACEKDKEYIPYIKNRLKIDESKVAEENKIDSFFQSSPKKRSIIKK